MLLLAAAGSLICLEDLELVPIVRHMGGQVNLLAGHVDTFAFLQGKCVLWHMLPSMCQSIQRALETHCCLTL